MSIEVKRLRDGEQVLRQPGHHPRWPGVSGWARPMAGLSERGPLAVTVAESNGESGQMPGRHYSCPHIVGEARAAECPARRRPP